jgi:hypothetical protein
MSFKSRWNQFKAWFKKHLPGWIHDLIQQVIEWLIPFLLQHGFTALVSEQRRTAYEAAKLPREPVAIPPELEHEDDC